MSFAFDVKTITDVEPATQEAVLDAMDIARDAGLQAEVNGQGMTSLEPPGLTAEAIGIGVALIVLVLTFGSLVAAGLPILSALVGVAIGVTGVTAATAFTDGIGSTTPILASMIGLAVGIDYALFILARYRSELQRTSNRAEAVGLAVGTAGSAVVFAGLTVLIALSALAVVGIPFLTAMGLAAAATVFIAVLVALTLLPAVLGMVKSKAFGGVVRKYEPKRDADLAIVNNGVRWARLIGRRPVIAALIVVVGLGGLAVVDARDVAEADRGAAFDDVAAWAGGQPGVVNAQVAGTNEEGSGAQVLITPEAAPDNPATQDLLTALRSTEEGTEASTGTTLGITGLTAVTTDVSDRLNDALPVYLALVIGLAFILLVVVFRSILVPLTATLGFLLSVLATLGTTVLVFQQGFFGLLEEQPIISFLPIFVIGVVFGLAMDYQVFLVTRMREAKVHGASSQEAIVDGFRNSARVVVAAAVIMTSVFAAFIFLDDPIISTIGFALAIAVVFDAFIIRMVLIPALLFIFGDAAWWMPKWLDRIVPKVDVEGETLASVRMAIAIEPVAEESTIGRHRAGVSISV